MLHVCRAPESLPARQCCSCFSGARRDDPFFIKPKAVLHPAVVAPTAVFFFFRSMQNSRPGGGNVEIFSSPCGPCRTRDWGGGGGGRGIEQSITNLRKDDIMVEIAYGPGLCMTI